MSCLFCGIVNGEITASIVFEDDISLAFLDHRPLFHGHSLLIPKQHFETLTDLPSELVQPLFQNAKTLTTAIETAMQAQGTFVAMNNRVSQSVPHLHIHIVPRRKGDGLKGFFWPRTKYSGDADMRRVQELIQAEVERARNSRQKP
jgi:histidine triad (HIT) family protein